MSALRTLGRSEEHTSELQSLAYLVCRLLSSTLFPYTTLFRSCGRTASFGSTMRATSSHAKPIPPDPSKHCWDEKWRVEIICSRSGSDYYRRDQLIGDSHVGSPDAGKIGRAHV